MDDFLSALTKGLFAARQWAEQTTRDINGWLDANPHVRAALKQYAAAVETMDPLERAALMGNATEDQTKELAARRARQTTAFNEWMMNGGGTLAEVLESAKNPPPDDPDVN